MGLLNKLSEKTQNAKLIIEPLGKCVIYLQSQLNSPYLKQNEMMVSRALMICCCTIFSCEHLEKIEQVFQTDLKNKVADIIHALILSKNTENHVIDIAVEGLSYLWLRFPSLISERVGIFDGVIQRIKSPTI